MGEFCLLVGLRLQPAQQACFLKKYEEKNQQKVFYKTSGPVITPKSILVVLSPPPFWQNTNSIKVNKALIVGPFEDSSKFSYTTNTL